MAHAASLIAGWDASFDLPVASSEARFRTDTKEKPYVSMPGNIVDVPILITLHYTVAVLA